MTKAERKRRGFPNCWSDAICDVNALISDLLHKRSLAWKRLSLSKKPESISARRKEVSKMEADLATLRVKHQWIMDRERRK